MVEFIPLVALRWQFVLKIIIKSLFVTMHLNAMMLLVNCVDYGYSFV